MDVAVCVLALLGDHLDHSGDDGAEDQEHNQFLEHVAPLFMWLHSTRVRDSGIAPLCKTMGMESNQGRADLARWKDAHPERYDDEPHLRALNRLYVEKTRASALETTVAPFGREAVALGDLIARSDHPDHRPRLAPWDGIGRRTERVEFDPAYHETGRAVWRSGMVALSGTPGTSFEQATLSYLLAHEGEMGHGCPATCTIGLVRALRRRAAPEVVARYLPALLETDYERADRGAQFLTEVQGGSDVGANVARAVPEGDGTYRIYGEKWFCSVADAEQFLLTARVEGGPEGTAGLGCFVAPRLLDGEPNGFTLRRLKDKLGTRAMASGEIDFTGALAHPIGPVEDGFKTAVSEVLNTSRWLNAVGDTGIMRRSYLEASLYAAHRTAFGSPIREFPAVRRILAGIKLDWLAGLHSTWQLTALDEAVDTGTAASDDAGYYRFLVNANKYAVAVRTTGVVRDAIEVLGGNGAIESFSPLPRLLRDAIVYEQWEGTHNVLAAQVRRDMSRLGLAAVVFERVARMVKGISHPELSDAATRAGASLEDLEGPVRRSLEDFEYGSIHFRDQLELLMTLVQAACLMNAADRVPEPALAGELRAVADLFVLTRVDREYRPGDDPAFMARVDAVLQAESEPPSPV